MRIKSHAEPIQANRSIELIARGVLINRDRVLLVRKKNGAYSFLPGGHIEPGESAVEALAREIREETGFCGPVGSFLGVVEHAWRDEHGSHQEINLIFLFKCRSLCRLRALPSREKELAFFWQHLKRLGPVNLQPWVLRKSLPQWLRSKQRGAFCSTL
jgi:8-oxo-dGTP pyrophosphatase MutT (NUDIX family)